MHLSINAISTEKEREKDDPEMISPHDVTTLYTKLMDLTKSSQAS
jgi:hypothetical protein